MGWVDWLFKGDSVRSEGGESSKADEEHHVDISDYLNDETFEEFAARRMQEWEERDHLGRAAMLKAQVKEAVKSKDNDTAWKLLHEIQRAYMQHANENGFTPRQGLALVGSVHRDMANVLRKEGKHREAMSHILYWVACNPADRRTKEMGQKLSAYFKRLKTQNHQIEDVLIFISHIEKNPDFREIQQQVASWG